jgi:ABC-type methionine transport system ATPase subunit
MKHLRIQLTFAQDTVTEPVIYGIVKRFEVVPNIRRAAIENHVGWMVLDLAGTPEALDSAIAYLRESGVDVASAEGDVIAG